MGRASKTPTATVSPISSKMQVMNVKAVCVFLGGISEDSLQKLRNDPEKRFPKPLQLLGTTPLWTVDQLERFLAREQKSVEALSA